MASAARSLRLVCRGARNHKPLPTLGPKTFVAWKSVGGGALKDVHLDEKVKPTPFDHWEEEDQAEDLKYRNMRPSQILKSVMVEDGEQAFLERDLAAIPDQDLAKQSAQMADITYPLRVMPRVGRNSFWDDEEPDPDLITGDEGDEFKEDDMTEMAHAKLDEIREQRNYARIAIWEMPLLAKYAKPFEPPSAEQPLRFRYTSYLGEYHPAEKKVVVEFSPADFGLTEAQQIKMIKLAGTRYNPSKQTIKMSSESFEHQAQNKRYLAETVEKLVADAKDPTDDFADIPLDLRHHKIKTKPKFPKEWRMSAERVEQIKDYRQEVKRLEDFKKITDKLIDGTAIINKSLAAKPRAARAAPELVTVRSHRQPRIRA